MKTKHTAGPWSVNLKVNRFVDAGPNGDGLITICDCDPIDEMTPAQAEANARLIAAAPELLNALESAVKYLEANRPKGKISNIFDQLNEHENGVLKPAKAALAKAKGETV